MRIKIKSKIFNLIGDCVQEYSVNSIEEAMTFNRDYLIGTPSSQRKYMLFGGDFSLQKLDNLDFKILKLIKNNTRFPVVDMAKKLNIDARTIVARIKRLEKNGVIQGYTVFLNLKKFGYQLYKLSIYLRKFDNSSFSELVGYCKKNKNLIHLIHSLGGGELELEIEENNPNNIYDYINKLKNRFPDLIKQIDLTTIVEELKLDFFPETIED